MRDQIRIKNTKENVAKTITLIKYLHSLEVFKIIGINSRYHQSTDTYYTLVNIRR